MQDLGIGLYPQGGIFRTVRRRGILACVLRGHVFEGEQALGQHMDGVVHHHERFHVAAGN